MRPRLLPVCSRRPSYNGTSLLSWQPCHSSPRGVKHMGWVNCLGVHPDPGQEVVSEPCFRHLPSARGGRAFQGEGVSPPHWACALGSCCWESLRGWRVEGGGAWPSPWGITGLQELLGKQANEWIDLPKFSSASCSLLVIVLPPVADEGKVGRKRRR